MRNWTWYLDFEGGFDVDLALEVLEVPMSVVEERERGESEPALLPRRDPLVGTLLQHRTLKRGNNV